MAGCKLRRSINHDQFILFFYYPVYPLADTMAIQTAQRYGRALPLFAYSAHSATRSSRLPLICHQCRGCVGHISYRHRHRRGHVALLVSSPRRSCGQVGACRAGALLKILRSKEILWFFGRTFCLAIAHRMNEAFLTLTLSELGAGEGLIGWS